MSSFRDAKAHPLDQSPLPSKKIDFVEFVALLLFSEVEVKDLNLIYCLLVQIILHQSG